MSLSVEKLEENYRKADEADKALFAEMRSNVLLVSGEHFSKSRNRINERLRVIQDMPNEARIKIALNHTARACHIWEGALHQYCPDIRVFPRNERELQDQKTAELNQSVWEYIKDKHINFTKHRIYAFQDFFRIGEVHTKLYFDPTLGEYKGTEVEVLEDGEQREKPVFSGKLCAKRIFAFNMLRAPEAQTFEESPYITLRELVETKVLKERYKNDDHAYSKIVSTADDTYKIFNALNGTYGESKEMTMVRETYYRPCMEYPNGYYYIWISGVVLEEGELPAGVFPIISEGCDEVQTSPRCRSKIKQLRPIQVEINRTISKIAETQATSDNQVWLQHGSKATPGAAYPGLRTNYYTGIAPVFAEGSSGAQYLDYLNSLISFFYTVAEIEEEMLENDKPSPEMYAELFKSMKQKKKYSVYAAKMENYFRNLCDALLRLAKYYLEEDAVIPMVGKSEQVNISEFKNTVPNSFTIKLEEMSDDLTTAWGRQLAINQAMQYASSNLERKDIGKLMSMMPFANFGEAFSDFTLEEEVAKNFCLALDRGDVPVEPETVDPAVIIRALDKRMLTPDFQYLKPDIQQIYMVTRQYFIDKQAMAAAETQRAQSGFIPADGPLVKVDYYINKPGSEKAERAIVPMNAVAWLLEKLADQQMSQEQLTTNYGAATQADITEAANNMGGMAQEAPGQPMPEQTQAF